MPFANPTRFLKYARKRREIMMRSQCEVRRPRAERVFDPATGTYSDPGYDVIYAGKCHVKAKSMFSLGKLESDVGEAEKSAQFYQIIVPVDCAWVDNGDHVIITASDDEWTVSRGPFPVAWVEYADSSTHRSLIVYAIDQARLNDG